MTGPPSDRTASGFGPEVRFEGGAIEVRRGLGVRVALLAAIVALGVIGALLLPVQVVVGALVMIASVVPAVALVRATTWQRLASGSGWILRGVPVPWDLLSGMVLHRASAEAAVVTTEGGPALPVAIPVPTREALRERRIAEDVIARHLHQLAHVVGRPPLPVSVDLGPERPTVPFDPRCARCSAG